MFRLFGDRDISVRERVLVVVGVCGSVWQFADSLCRSFCDMLDSMAIMQSIILPQSDRTHFSHPFKLNR